MNPGSEQAWRWFFGLAPHVPLLIFAICPTIVMVLLFRNYWKCEEKCRAGMCRNAIVSHFPAQCICNTLAIASAQGMILLAHTEDTCQSPHLKHMVSTCCIHCVYGQSHTMCRCYFRCAACAKSAAGLVTTILLAAATCMPLPNTFTLSVWSE